MGILMDFNYLTKKYYEDAGHTSITIGIVKENWNEANKGKIKAELLFGEEGRTETLWIRVSSLYTANNGGMYMLPEVGSEVLVAFITGNYNEPVVIGSLWNDKTTALPEFAVENNSIKAFRTKEGNEIIVQNEENKSEILIRSANKLSLSLSDENKLFKVMREDSKSSIEVNFEDGSIRLDAEKEISLAVGGNDLVKITDKGITLKADTIKLEGKTLNIEGKTTEIKGNTVNIN